METKSTGKVDPEGKVMNINQVFFLVGVVFWLSLLGYRHGPVDLSLFEFLLRSVIGVCVIAIIFNLLGEVGD